MNEQFWHGKKVFLTGHTGFKGAWLSLWLAQMGAEVTGFALLPASKSNLFEMADVAKDIHSVTGDIRDAAQVASALKASKAEIVIHMAAQALVRQSYADPVETYSTNVMGLVNVFEAARQTPSVRAIVNVTSDKCYENKEWHWGYREDEAMGGFDPYSSSKGCAELITSAYRRSFFQPAGVALASARAGNVIGGGDWAADRLIPDIIRALSKGEPVLIRNPHAIRPWQHVLEPLSGYLTLTEHAFNAPEKYASGWNFGPNECDAKPVNWIADALTKVWGTGASWKLEGGTHPHEAHYLKLDCAKAKAELGWQAKWDLTTALTYTANWYQSIAAAGSARDITLSQIKTYCETL